MKKVLVSGYIGFNNFGDEAIFYALSKHLKEKNIEVSVFCNNTDETKEKYNVKTYYYKSVFAILLAIFKNDIIISGGGSLLQNKTGNFSLYYYLFILFLAKLFGKKTIIFAQGVEPIKGKLNEFFLKFILKKMDFISVRDLKSKLYLKKLKIDSVLVSDPVYSILQETSVSKNKNGLIIQLRNNKSIDDKFIENLASQISENFNKNIKIMSLQDTFDMENCKKLQQKLSELKIESELIKQTSILNIINIINNAEYMISTRLHGALVANALNTKTFTLNYDEKLKTFSEELFIPNINLECYSFAELNEKLDKFFNNDYEFKKYRKFDWSEFDCMIEKL